MNDHQQKKSKSPTQHKYKNEPQINNIKDYVPGFNQFTHYKPIQIKSKIKTNYKNIDLDNFINDEFALPTSPPEPFPSNKNVDFVYFQNDVLQPKRPDIQLNLPKLKNLHKEN